MDKSGQAEIADCSHSSVLPSKIPSEDLLLDYSIEGIRRCEDQSICAVWASGSTSLEVRKTILNLQI